MSRIRVKGFKIFKDRHGKMRCYHRTTGHKIDLALAPLGSAEFFAECAKIVAAAEANKSLAPKPGTLGGLVQCYFATEHFANLAPATRRDYAKCADFLHAIRDTPVSAITTPLIAGIHDKAAQKLGWRRANMVRTFLGQVFKFAIPKGLIDRDYSSGVIPKPRPKNRPYANRPWTRQEQAVVLERAAPHIRVAIALIMHTGLDPSDAINLVRAQVDGDTIWGRRGKTGTEVAIPISKRLAAALEAAPIHDAPTILANSQGKTWTYNGFSTVWHRFKKELEAEGAVAPGLTLKGLRHTVATTLREAGISERAIADLLGQKTDAMARHYSRSANLENRNRKTLATLEKVSENRGAVVKPINKAVKP